MFYLLVSLFISISLLLHNFIISLLEFFYSLFNFFCYSLLHNFIIFPPPPPPQFYYSWFARDVTKNQTKKLSIFLSFYFHQVLQ